MGKGGYHGGSTVVGRNSGWFTGTGPRPKRKQLTIEQVAKLAKKDAKKARKQQAKGLLLHGGGPESMCTKISKT